MKRVGKRGAVLLIGHTFCVFDKLTGTKLKKEKNNNDVKNCKSYKADVSNFYKVNQNRKSQKSFGFTYSIDLFTTTVEIEYHELNSIYHFSLEF